MARKYSLKEIDRMRLLLYYIQSIKVYGDGSYYYYMVKSDIVEQHLRTYMIGNVSPKEIEKAWKRKLKELHKHNIHDYDDVSENAV